MSAIYKLSIQGIRSFDSNDRETIEFGKPLTLIVGANGSGKTTIIECLKYATSGDLPPNSKGGAFIHDPKITGEKDVRAQVKLAFTSANALNMIVTRNIQLLVKKASATFKTLEGQLVIVNNNGGRNTLSTRSVELDHQVPLYMGVPKAILEYVIFCHQEDSLWPLSEPSNLKKKFDEIFQAMKFTKALDNLKGIKKDMSVDIKLLKQSVEHLKVDRDRSEAVKLEISRLEAKVVAYNNEVKDIEKKLSAVTKQSDTLFKTNQDFQKVLSRAENLRHDKNSTNDQISRLSNAIDIVDISRPVLEDNIRNFSSSLEEREASIETLRAEVDSMKSKSAQLQTQCNFMIRRQGELNAATDAHKKNLEKLEELHLNLSQKYSICDMKKESKDSFLEELLTVQRKLEDQFKGYNSEGKSIINTLEKSISHLKNSLIIQKERLDYSRMDEEKLIREIDRLDTELQLSEYTEEDLEKERDSLAKFSDKLHNWEKNDDVKKFNLEIKDKNDQMLILESELEDIQRKIAKTNQRADLYAKLSVVKKLTKERSDELANQLGKIAKNEQFSKWEISAESNFEIDFKGFVAKLTKESLLKEEEFRDRDRKFSEVLYNYNNMSRDIEKMEETRFNLVKILEEALPEDCPIGEYEDVVAETELSYKTALENLKMHQTTLAFNRRAIEIAKKESTCYLCCRKFEDNGFKNSLLQKLEAKIDVDFEKGLNKIVEEEKKYLMTLRNLKKQVLEFQTCGEKLRSLRDAKIIVKEKVDVLDREKGILSKEYLKSKNELIVLEKELHPVIENITRCKKELKALQNDVRTVYDELVLYGTSEENIQTVDELQVCQKDKNDMLRKLRKDINELQETKESKSTEYSNLLGLIKERNLKVTEIEKELSSSKNVENDIKNKRNQLTFIKSTVANTKSEVEDLTKKIAELENEEYSRRREFDFKISSFNTKMNELERDVLELRRVTQMIDDFNSTGLEGLDEYSLKLAECQRSLNELNNFIEIKTLEFSDETQKIKDSTNQKRNLEQNLQLLDLRAKLEKLEVEIKEINIINAETERNRYQEESLRLRGEYEELSSENAGKLGEMKQLQNQIRSLSNQLATEYKDVYSHYHRRWVELQTKTFVNDDIDTYSKALDSAIMRYHGLKMQDINRIIDELWKRTYSGTDVDSIQIKSDEVKNGMRGKSYNYRVVMYKQDAELDMRGRCSAGQKVLASIIIRLALSETFGVNCGVIALDEPTTNLDEENIESLAKALNNIIQLRRHQKNFQLIVITHDEKFLNNMNASEFTDHFFRVKRDDRQKSQIEWVDISRVTD